MLIFFSPELNSIFRSTLVEIVTVYLLKTLAYIGQYLEHTATRVSIKHLYSNAQAKL